jgi:hypothetical protein
VQNCSPRSRPEVAKKSPSGGPGGLGELGLLILETKTHPVTACIMIDERTGSLPYELKWIACILLLLQLFGKQVAVVCRSSSSVTRSRRRRYRLTFWHLMKRSMLVSVHKSPSLVGCKSAETV